MPIRRRLSSETKDLHTHTQQKLQKKQERIKIWRKDKIQKIKTADTVVFNVCTFRMPAIYGSYIHACIANKQPSVVIYLPCHAVATVVLVDVYDIVYMTVYEQINIVFRSFFFVLVKNNNENKRQPQKQKQQHTHTHWTNFVYRGINGAHQHNLEKILKWISCTRVVLTIVCVCVVDSKQFEFCPCDLLSFTFNRIINDRPFVIESSTRVRVRIAHIDASLNKHYWSKRQAGKER